MVYVTERLRYRRAKSKRAVFYLWDKELDLDRFLFMGFPTANRWWRRLKIGEGWGSPKKKTDGWGKKKQQPLKVDEKS